MCKMLEARGQRLFLVSTTSFAQISAHESQLKEVWLDRSTWAIFAAVLLTHRLSSNYSNLCHGVFLPAI